MRVYAAALTLVAPLFASAQEKKEPPKVVPIAEIKIDRKDPVIYEKDVEPILANKCMYCHSGNVVENKFDMSTYDRLLKGGKRGASITAGRSAESVLYKMAGHQVTPIMPPAKEEQPLTPMELALIKLWIDQGAKPPTMKIEKPKIVVGIPPSIIKTVRAVAVSADGKQVAAARSNQAFLFNPVDGKAIKSFVDPNLTTADKKPVAAAHLSLVESMAFSPDGKTLATGSFQEVILWDVEKGTIKQKITGFADKVVAIAYSHDGKLFVTGGGAPTEDGEMKLFDDTGKLVFDFKSSHSDTVFGVCFSPDDKKLASCGADKFVKTWEIPSGKLIKAFEGHTHHVLDVGWMPDGKQLASAGADNNIKIWDFEKGEQVKTVNAHQKQVTRLLFIGKSGNFLTASGDKSVKMWNAGGSNMRTFAGGADFVYAVSASTDGKVVVTGGEEGVIRMYNGDAGGQPTKILYPPGEEPKPKEDPKKKETPKKK
jgi:WD40 repeat protein